MGALGAGALLPGCQTTAETASGKPHRIDIHHHFAPPGYSTELKALKALLTIIPTSQVLFGTDYPFWDGRRVSTDLAKGPLTAADRLAIDRGNAMRLFPRLKS